MYLSLCSKQRLLLATVTVFEILEPVALQWLVVIPVSYKTGHDVNGSFRISDLQITA